MNKPFANVMGVDLYEDEEGDVFVAHSDPDDVNQRVWLLVGGYECSQEGVEQFCSGLRAALLTHIGATADTAPPPPPAYDGNKGILVQREAHEDHYPKGNDFIVEEDGTLYVLSGDEEREAAYASGSWKHARHGNSLGGDE